MRRLIKRNVASLPPPCGPTAICKKYITGTVQLCINVKHIIDALSLLVNDYLLSSMTLFTSLGFLSRTS